MCLAKKIKDNYSFKEMDFKFKGYKILSSMYKMASKIGLKNDTMDESFNKLVELNRQYNQIKETPDDFNSFFSEQGWIAYETMNFDIMLKSVELAKSGSKDEAEQILVDYYSEDTLRFSIMRLKGIEEFRPRINLTYNALDDYLAQRYYACIPIILMMIDGFVNDFEQKGFFASEVNLSIWDSIAAHDSGLNQLACIFGKSRKKTTSEEIRLPYRNGILHGRDLGYGNKMVAAKSWAALFAIGDWARALKDGKKGIEKVFKPPTLKESVISLTESLKQYSQIQEEKKTITDWHPRKMIVGLDVSEMGEDKEYELGSPERTLVEFLTYLKKSNYGKMAQCTTKLCPSTDSVGKIAKEVREIFQQKQMTNFKIINIRDEAPAISEIDTALTFELNSNEVIHNHTFRLIYQDDECNSYVRGHDKGMWKILWNFYPIEFVN